MSRLYENGATSIDWSLYLFTDPDIIPEGSDICAHVQEAIKGGCTVVQLRKKTNDTGLFIEKAKKLPEITRVYNVLLLIMTPFDVALAPGADGIHVGQDDMDLKDVRKLLGPDAIIETKVGIAGHADYFGLSPIWNTNTKKLTKPLIGTMGTRTILSYVKENAGYEILCVAIGGFKDYNIQCLIFQGRTGAKSVSGIAIVSAIMASTTPYDAAKSLLTSIKIPAPFIPPPPSPSLLRPGEALFTKIMTKIGKNANVSLAVGASPIMSENALEVADLMRINGALLLNIGTAHPESPTAMLKALRIANTAGTLVLLNPVGVEATQFRKDTAAGFLASGYCDINSQAEIRALLNLRAQACGVDSLHSSSSSSRAELASTFARREQNTVVVSGAVDVVSDGERTFCVSNGDAMFGFVICSGCTLRTVIAACAAVEEDKCVAAVSGCVVYGVAAGHAVRREEVRGPGMVQAALVDEIWRIRGECGEGNLDWMRS
ncbi:TMP-TENI-domain-containing protein [Saitoella complicata NRRL Y-17804]|uniref:TMP-TENI-domain-containing protein n=1 Tax=Saitoella complicata (strain BCRC 22490 / CBS 7301 / JCM 7358 / NBRC 10748 / NRRL Y-17804) TaxID=698492 RepID=UPI0008682AC9|nr:TMP-TENI-domain-containing protein [Saitoella complicata NRRL Y-17804]ODQ56517.1 TMP-TENI-domain-containing protein [Saitoella complicata NRRL Y-17804]